MNQYLETFCLLSGRFLLGVYFILPGITKVTGFDTTLAYMADHNVPLTTVLLIVTIIIQLGAGTALIIGFKAKYMAFILAGLTLVISIYMHNFWDIVDDDASLAQEHGHHGRLANGSRAGRWQPKCRFTIISQ